MLSLAAVLAAPAAPALADMQAGLQAAEQGDYATAYYEWKPLADEGDPDALFNIGRLYEDGLFVRQDLARAIDFYARAAERNHQIALFQLGTLAEAGTGMEQDYVQAAKYYEASAAAGWPQAMVNLGRLYAEGLGVEEDLDRAIELYRTAAEEHGLPKAQFNLAIRAPEELRPGRPIEPVQ